VTRSFLFLFMSFEAKTHHMSYYKGDNSSNNNLYVKEQTDQVNLTLIKVLYTNKQVYLTYYKNGNRITETEFIQFVDSLGEFVCFYR